MSKTQQTLIEMRATKSPSSTDPPHSDCTTDTVSNRKVFELHPLIASRLGKMEQNLGKAGFNPLYYLNSECTLDTFAATATMVYERIPFGAEKDWDYYWQELNSMEMDSEPVENFMKIYKAVIKRYDYNQPQYHKAWFETLVVKEQIYERVCTDYPDTCTRLIETVIDNLLLDYVGREKQLWQMMLHRYCWDGRSMQMKL